MEFGLVVSEGSGENAENNHEANHRTSLEVRCCIYSRLSTECHLEVLLHVSQTYCLGGWHALFCGWSEDLLLLHEGECVFLTKCMQERRSEGAFHGRWTARGTCRAFRGNRGFLL